MTITRSARAKINLALAVAPPRPDDGYHPICSWFAPIGLADDLAFTRLCGGEPARFEVRWAADAPRPSPIDWPAEKDLAMRALRAIEREAGRALPVAITIEKRIPVGAGLGGGSSDCAAALEALRELFALPIDDERLRALGASLGADVPFFLPPAPGAPALVEGLGERLTRTARIRSTTGAEQRILLVMPPFGCPTGAVYKSYDSAPSAAFERDAARVRAMAAQPFVDAHDLFNDLAEPAMRVQPALCAAHDTVASIAGAPCHVTGSGSGLFVVLDEGGGAACGAPGLTRSVEESMPGCAARIVALG